METAPEITCWISCSSGNVSTICPSPSRTIGTASRNFSSSAAACDIWGYLVEGDVKEFEDHPSITEQSVKAIKSAAAQTEIFDGFRVIRTENLKDTHDLLGRMTVAARELYANLTAADGATPSRDESHAPPTLAEYNASLVAAKRGLSTLKTVWGSMLMQVSGLGPEMAQAIIERFPRRRRSSAYAQCGGRRRRREPLGARADVHDQNRRHGGEP